MKYREAREAMIEELKNTPSSEHEFIDPVAEAQEFMRDLKQKTAEDVIGEFGVTKPRSSP